METINQEYIAGKYQAGTHAKQHIRHADELQSYDLFY